MSIKRGSSMCQGCGHSNGNRALQCKECGHPFMKKARVAPSVPSEVNINVTSLLSSNALTPGSQVYSVRIRDQGPDYRCFVSCSNGKWRCQFGECILAQDGRDRSGLDMMHTGSTCQHVKVAQKSRSSMCGIQDISLSSSVLKNAPFPPSVRAEFEAHLINGRTSLIQRVSNKSFVIATTPSSESPLGLLHARIGPRNNFQCTCHKFKRGTSLASSTTAPKLSKRCTHYYLFLWALLSNESLKNEFDNDSVSSEAAGGEAAGATSQKSAQVDKVNKCVRNASGFSSLEQEVEPTGENSRVHELQDAKLPSSRVRSTKIVADKTEKIPESPDHPMVEAVFRTIQIKDANYVLQQEGRIPCGSMIWADEYSPDDIVCVACNRELPSKSKLSGTRGKAWLLSKQGFRQVEVFVKTCIYQDCQARHTFRDWKSGIFNVSNKLLVTFDLLFEMREHIKRGEPPGNTANAVILSSLDLPSAPKLTQGESRYLAEKLYDGYFAFEVLTNRDWNSAICGICGVCPLFESGDGNAKNCTPLSGQTIQWPKEEELQSISEEVDAESWWSYLEQKILEGMVFKDIQLEKVKAVSIAPWLPPACRGCTLNTEHLKSNSHRSHPTPIGCPKTLARLICQGDYDPLNLGSASITQLKDVCDLVKIPKELAKTKPQMVRHLESLHTFIYQGSSECHMFEAVPNCSGGKVFKNCQHQVISGSKFILKKESTRDHVDLLLSSKHWPLAYAVDMACDVVAHMAVRAPKLARALWGERRGCFEKPKIGINPKIINVPELDPKNQAITANKTYDALVHDHTYTHLLQHPLTNTSNRYVVGDRFHDGPKTSGHKKETCRYHCMDLCPQLKTYRSVTSEVINSKIRATRLQSSNQQNIYHYFIYNRLMDYYHNKAIVQKQYQAMLSRAQYGEKVTRDYLYRFVYTNKV